MTRYAYQILLIASLIGNAFLGWNTHWTAERLSKIEEQKSALEATKARLENTILEAQTTPGFVISRVSYELSTFRSLLRRQALIPFLSSIKDYRIVENTVLATVERDLNRAQTHATGGTVSFLIIANVGNVPAYGLTVAGANSVLVDLGALQPNSAILIPTKYTERGQSADHPEVSFSSLRYQTTTHPTVPWRELPIPPPVAQAWTPVLTNLRGIGRALIEDDDKHVSSVLPDLPE